MKELYIVRHAKSSWEDPGLADHDRPLLPIGVTKTQKIVGFLKRKDIRPGLMLSSTATRALETAKIIAAGTGYAEEDIRTTEKLYHGSPDTILNELYGLPDDIGSVMVFGHNPGLTYFVNRYLDPSIDNLPTSGVVGIRFEADHWEELPGARFTVMFLMTPKMIKS